MSNRSIRPPDPAPLPEKQSPPDLMTQGLQWLEHYFSPQGAQGLVGLGLTLAGVGLFVQQRLEWLRWLLSHWRSNLLTWK